MLPDRRPRARCDSPNQARTSVRLLAVLPGLDEQERNQTAEQRAQDHAAVHDPVMAAREQILNAAPGVTGAAGARGPGWAGVDGGLDG